MEKLSDVFTKEYLKRLDSLCLHMKGKLSVGGYSGARKAKAQGNSLEFSDYREYVAGDDLRRIDWNNYARFQKMYMKIFLEEKQAVINLFIDQSLSMTAGKKALYSKALAGSVAYIALKNMDKVNFFSWSEGIQNKKLNMQAGQSFAQAVQFLEELEQNGETSFTKTIKQCSGLPLGRGISILFSDLLTEDDWKEGIKLLQHKKQEVILVWVLAKEEVSPQVRGAIRMVDQETKQARDLEVTADVLKSYEKALQSYEAEIREFCKKRDVTFVKVIEDMPLLKVVSSMM